MQAMEATTSTDNYKITEKPPSIFCLTSNHAALCSSLIQLIGLHSYSCQIKRPHIVILTNSHESYRSVISFLNERKSSYKYFIDYKRIEEPTVKIVIRNIDPDIEKYKIKMELEQLGFKAKSFQNVFHRKSKKPVPILFVDLELSSNTYEVFNVKELCNTKVVIHKYRSKK